MDETTKTLLRIAAQRRRGNTFVSGKRYSSAAKTARRSIAEKIRRGRGELGLSQWALARQTGLVPSVVSNAERGNGPAEKLEAVLLALEAAQRETAPSAAEAG